jgi:hypothetical protein
MAPVFLAAGASDRMEQTSRAFYCDYMALHCASVILQNEGLFLGLKHYRRFLFSCWTKNS